LEIEQNEIEIDEDEEDYGSQNPGLFISDEWAYAAHYNEDGFECVRAESKESLDNARKLVYNEAIRLRDKFQSVINKLEERTKE